MKFIKKLLIVTLFVLPVLTTNAFEKVGTTSFQFLKVIPTARAYGMAGAYVSIANTSEAVFWNPANLIMVENFSAAFGYADWFLDVKHYSFSAAYTLEGMGTFALFGMVADVGEIEETKVSSLGFLSDGTYNPGLTGNVFSPKSTVLGISYGLAMNDRFSFGITMKYASEDLVYESASAIVFDAGLRYDTGFRSIIIAASLRHFGGDIKFIDRKYPLPQTLNIGISSYLFAPADPLISSFGNQSLLLSYDLIQPRDFDQQHALGLEYSFNGMLFLRGGYLFNADQEDLSLGAGINYLGYKVDYAYNGYGEHLDSVHRITIGVNFD
jgi:hypothetical protein